MSGPGELRGDLSAFFPQNRRFQELISKIGQDFLLHSKDSLTHFPT